MEFTDNWVRMTLLDTRVANCFDLRRTFIAFQAEFVNLASALSYREKVLGGRFWGVVETLDGIPVHDIFREEAVA